MLSDIRDEAIEYAKRRGKDEGRSSASWIDINDITAPKILKGLEDGDPQIYDKLPHPDLSGEWSGNLTGPELVKEAFEHAFGYSMVEMDEDNEDEWNNFNDGMFMDICDAYDEGFMKAMEADVIRHCKIYTLWTVGSE